MSEINKDPETSTKLVGFTDEQAKDKQTVRYNLAKGSERIWARVIDMLIMIAVCAIFFCMIFLINKPDTPEEYQPYRYFIFSFFAFVLNFAYFVVLQRLWKGQTLGMKAFKLATYNQVFNNFTWHIIKKELLLWMILGFLQLTFGIALCVVGYTDSPKAAWGIIQNMWKGGNGTEQIFGIVYGCLFAICGIILILVALDTGVHSRRQSFSDRFSNTCAVKKVDVFSNKENDNKNKKKNAMKRNYALPGAILDSPHDTIDSLDEKEEDKE